MACDCGKTGKPVTPMGKWGTTYGNESSKKTLTVSTKKSPKTTRVTVGKRK